MPFFICRTVLTLFPKEEAAREANEHSHLPCPKARSHGEHDPLWYQLGESHCKRLTSHGRSLPGCSSPSTRQGTGIVHPVPKVPPCRWAERRRAAPGAGGLPFPWGVQQPYRHVVTPSVTTACFQNYLFFIPLSPPDN